MLSARMLYLSFLARSYFIFIFKFLCAMQRCLCECLLDEFFSKIIFVCLFKCLHVTTVMTNLLLTYLKKNDFVYFFIRESSNQTHCYDSKKKSNCIFGLPVNLKLNIIIFFSLFTVLEKCKSKAVLISGWAVFHHWICQMLAYARKKPKNGGIKCSQIQRKQSLKKGAMMVFQLVRFYFNNSLSININF